MLDSISRIELEWNRECYRAQAKVIQKLRPNTLTAGDVKSSAANPVRWICFVEVLFLQKRGNGTKKYIQYSRNQVISKNKHRRKSIENSKFWQCVAYIDETRFRFYTKYKKSTFWCHHQLQKWDADLKQNARLIGKIVKMWNLHETVQLLPEIWHLNSALKLNNGCRLR